MGTAYRHGTRGHFVSPDDVISELTVGVADPSTMVCASARWPEIQLVEMHFPESGGVVIPPIAFYSISSHTGTRSYLSPDVGSAQEAVLLPPGSTLVHEAGMGARYAWHASHDAWMTCLDPQVVTEAAGEVGLAGPGPVRIASSFQRRDDVSEHLIRALAAEAKLGAHATQPLMVQSIATALACHLLERFGVERPRRPVRRPGTLAPRAFERVRAYVEDNVGGPISLADLARAAGVSRFHFARQFRSTTGESAMSFVRRVRIDRAKRLLVRRDGTVAEVAANLGFADQSHFTRVFRRLVGVPPRDFALANGARVRGGSVDRPRIHGRDWQPILDASPAKVG